MSDTKLISPMLDGYLMGEAFSDHNGVRCCPAIRESSGQQYIVKIISIPASQVQMAALLLTGACRSREEASAYFLELAKDLVREIGLLGDLSRLEGFYAFADYQVVPMENGVGFDVYLLSPYRTSLEAMLKENRMTQLAAVNLGLDLCAALAASRRAGYLYVDLKPANVFHTQEQGFRIGDLGFAALSSLSFSSLQKNYRSAYTAPEAADDMAVLNDTMDIYALGLVLYQCFNGGLLPEPGENGIAPPMYADYEMSEIILKACAPAPEDRWQEPAQLGQALVGYMQRNGVSDCPIIPAPVQEPAADAAQEDTQAEDFLPDSEPDQEELEYIRLLAQEEAAYAAENAEPVSEDALTEDAAQMLAKADDLIAHQPPEPVVAPTLKPIPVPELVRDISDPALAEIPTEEEFFAEVRAEEQSEAAAQVHRSHDLRPWIRIAALVLAAVLVLGAALGGWYYYKNYYLQNIEKLVINGTESTLTVQVISDTDEALLTVVCIDSYGNPRSSPVVAGVAVFHDLDPNTRYNIRVDISGNHKLTGVTSSSYTTAEMTTIQDLTAVIGPEDGSVLLSFRVDGRDTDAWLLTYSAPGVESKTLPFTGHSVTVSDLQLGATYTFTLSSQDAVYIAGQNSVSFVPGRIVFAQDLSVPFWGGGKLMLAWNAPEDTQVLGWTLRCYNENGYDETVHVTDTGYTFEDLDTTAGYTVEVFAEGMNQCVYISVGANPIHITSAHFDATIHDVLRFSWTFDGKAPEGGWIVSYTIGDASFEMNCSDTVALLAAVPGSQYTLTVRAADGTPVYGGESSYTLPSDQLPDSPDTPNETD